jgi:maleate cis-trans isomerase
MYADYEYYSGTFHGNTIPGAEFDKYATRASSYLDHVTLKRVTVDNLTDDIKKATCAVAEVYYDQDLQVNNMGNYISSESVGTHRVEIKSKIRTKKELDKELYDKVFFYLSLTGLLYRGIY